MTYDVDFWVDDRPENRRRCEQALVALNAEWGPTDATWEAVVKKQPGWLDQQNVYCLLTPAGAVDIFRTVAGLPDWQQCRERACEGTSSDGTLYFGLSDEDMLNCQLAL